MPTVPLDFTKIKEYNIPLRTSYCTMMYRTMSNNECTGQRNERRGDAMRRGTVVPQLASISMTTKKDRSDNTAKKKMRTDAAQELFSLAFQCRSKLGLNSRNIPRCFCCLAIMAANCPWTWHLAVKRSLSALRQRAVSSYCGLGCLEFECWREESSMRQQSLWISKPAFEGNATAL